MGIYIFTCNFNINIKETANYAKQILHNNAKYFHFFFQKDTFFYQILNNKNHHGFYFFSYQLTSKY